MQVPGPFEYERATSVDHAIGLLDRLGDGAMLVALTRDLGGRMVDPLKTTVVQDERCMTTWVVRKSA